MTNEEFLEYLKKTPRNWEIVSEFIRLKSPDLHMDCPITAVATKINNEQYNSELDVVDAAESIGLDVYQTDDIICASDSWYEDHHKELRNDILKACGLGD